MAASAAAGSRLFPPQKPAGKSAQRWSPVVDQYALPQPDNALRGAIEIYMPPEKTSGAAPLKKSQLKIAAMQQVCTLLI
jgi:hypothetical protein